MRISDWSSDVCSSDLVRPDHRRRHLDAAGAPAIGQRHLARAERHLVARDGHRLQQGAADHPLGLLVEIGEVVAFQPGRGGGGGRALARMRDRSEEHTSELQSLMRSSYAVFCLKKTKETN